MGQLGEISAFVERAGRAAGLSEDQVYDVQMAVDEACTNIMSHAYRGRNDGAIEIACESRASEFVVAIRDWGKQFDPKKIPQPNTSDPLDRRKIGGLGLFFMKQMMDRVKFSFSKDQGNLLVMTKKIKK